ncbi:MAG: Gfo/Idh/MocA family oxidoreductase [Candidatus Omnitrophica bacterium]|nr:Gfo/Idh/MocA family oxidoreductase [Candidatus Omnitrophota bacterium]
MEKIKVGVIGVGKLGYIHARVYSEMKDVELVGVCDINQEKAKKVAQELKTEFYFDYREIIPYVDAVSIAVPTSLHYPIGKEFLKNGVHCLIEKPLAINLKEAKGLLKIAEGKKSILQVGHIERFNPAIQTILKLPGEPRFIECHRLGNFSPRVKDVGVVLDLMIHDLDIVLTLVKAKVESIDALGVNVLTTYEDIANARIKFEDGTICNLTASRVSDERMRKIRIFKENSYISLDYFKQEVLIYYKRKNRVIHRFLPVKKEEPLKEELKSFINCIYKKGNPLVSGEEAYNALKLAFRILKKIKENERKNYLYRCG